MKLIEEFCQEWSRNQDVISPHWGRLTFAAKLHFYGHCFLHALYNVFVLPPLRELPGYSKNYRHYEKL